MPTRRPANTRPTSPQRPQRPQQPQRTQRSQRPQRPQPRSNVARFVPFIVVAIAVVIVIAVGLSFCSRSNTPSTANVETPTTNQLEAQDVASNESANTTTVNAPSVDEIVAELPDVIEEEDKVALAERAQTDADALWIAQHADDYAFIDSYIQWKMLRLAAYEPQATPFVRNVMDLYPASSASTWNGTLKQGEVPHLYQWDTAWGYTDYCGLPFGMSGCCPTAFSMVAMALSGSTECTPYVAGVDAEENGYAVDYIGSDGSFISQRAEAYGFSAYSTSLSGSELIQELQSGNLVICNVGPGDFTVGGHFIVATGVDSDGQVIINDPYSTRNSAKTWDADRIADQTTVFYVCSK